MISREKLSKKFWAKTSENVGDFHFFVVDNFDFRKKIVKFWQNWIFGQNFDFSNSVNKMLHKNHLFFSDQSGRPNIGICEQHDWSTFTECLISEMMQRRKSIFLFENGGCERPMYYDHTILQLERLMNLWKGEEWCEFWRFEQRTNWKKEEIFVLHIFFQNAPRALVFFWSLLPSLSFAVIERKIVKKYFPLVEKNWNFFFSFCPSLLREFMKN